MDAEFSPAAVLGSFVAEFEYDDVPAACVAAVERAYLDTVGVLLAGITEGAGEVAAETVAALSGSMTSTGSGAGVRIPDRPERATVTDAGFVGGTASHCLDFDDWAEPTGGHPSAVLVPTTLAIADSDLVAGTDAIGGTDAIAAYVAGFETMAAILAPIHPAHYEAGWHTTGTVGVFGAAATAAALFDLDAGQTSAALCVAASMPSGVQRNFGTMSKPMHVGDAVRGGILAALLAREGFSAADDAIAGDDGFWDVYGGAAAPDPAAFADPRDGLALAEWGIHTKRYPSCGGTHPAIAATTALRDELDLDPSRIDRIAVTAAPVTGDALRFDDPDTGFQGKFSMPYAVAAAATGDVTLDTFTDAAVADPAVQEVRERVSFAVDRDLPYQSTEATVRIRTADGDSYERTVEHPPGSPANPLSGAELHAKFLDCSTRAIDEERAQAAASFLESLRDRADVAGIYDALSSTA